MLLGISHIIKLQGKQSQLLKTTCQFQYLIKTLVFASKISAEYSICMDVEVQMA